MNHGTRHARNRGWWGYMKYITRKYGSIKIPSSDFERRELEAVQRAVDETVQMRDGLSRVEFIEMYYWKRSHSLQGAAMKLGVSERTALRWHGEFIKCVAAEFFGDDSLREKKGKKKGEEQR